MVATAGSKEALIGALNNDDHKPAARIVRHWDPLPYERKDVRQFDTGIMAAHTTHKRNALRHSSPTEGDLVVHRLIRHGELTYAAFGQKKLPHFLWGVQVCKVSITPSLAWGQIGSSSWSSLCVCVAMRHTSSAACKAERARKPQMRLITFFIQFA